MSFNLEKNSITTLINKKRRRESDENEQDITKKLKFEDLRIQENPIESTIEEIEIETLDYLKNTLKFSNLEAFLIEIGAKEFESVMSLNKT